MGPCPSESQLHSEPEPLEDKGAGTWGAVDLLGQQSTNNGHFRAVSGGGSHCALNGSSGRRWRKADRSRHRNSSPSGHLSSRFNRSGAHGSHPGRRPGVEVQSAQGGGRPAGGGLSWGGCVCHGRSDLRTTRPAATWENSLAVERPPGPCPERTEDTHVLPSCRPHRHHQRGGVFSPSVHPGL